MKSNFLNRNFPVFFVCKISMYLLIALFFVCCKSKSDWRTSDTKKNTVTKKISKPKTVDDIGILLNEDVSSLKNNDLYQFIIEWYGTPYRYGGISKNGVDCSGFTNLLYQNVYDKKIPRTSKEIAEKIKSKKISNLKEGDLVFFAFGKSKNINHVGIYLLNDKFVHASTSKGVIISDLTEPWYGKALVKCGSY